MRAVLVASAVALAGLAAPQTSLRVLRVTPTGTAEPTDAVTVTFDRPVAGRLDGSVDPRTVLTIAPVVEGRAEWRDPITLRYTPSEPLAPGSAYTVTVMAGLRAMDGSRLEQAHRFSFRVGGPRVLDGTPVGRYTRPEYLAPGTAFELLVSAPVDLAVASRLVRLELAGCGGPSAVALRAVAQRPVGPDDPQRYQWAGGWRRDRRADALRRVVRFAAEQPLPYGCAGVLTMPETLDAAGAPGALTWAFATYGPLRLAAFTCTNEPLCPAGFARVRFTTPVRGADVQRLVRLEPATAFAVRDTAESSADWVLEAPLRTRTRYTVIVDPALRDEFGQRFTGPQTDTLVTTGYASSLSYPTGRMLVERHSFRTLAVRHVNVDTLYVTQATVPRALEARVLAAPEWNIGDVWSLVEGQAATRAIPVRSQRDVPLVSAVRLPAFNAAAAGTPTIAAVRVATTRQPDRADAPRGRRGGVALVQVTDLGVAARLGAAEAVVWVTSVRDGRALANVEVALHDAQGAVRARGTTDSTGLVRLSGFPPRAPADDGEERGFEGYVEATLGGDRALVPFDRYAWELSPWRFNVTAADTDERLPAAAAVFTERGIYRPGEVVHAKTIVRTGNLGALRAPARGDSLRWVVYDREDGSLHDSTVALSAFGTADRAFPLAPDLPLGTYRVGVALRRDGRWAELATASFRVAEYRPPEFLVTVLADTAPRVAGDSLGAAVEARYLFGAPMARAAVQWTVRRTPVLPWDLGIPGAEAFTLGETGWWWEDDDTPTAAVTASGTDTLDDAGRLALRIGLQAAPKHRAARVSVQAVVTDVNRQSVAGTSTAMVHPAAFYVGARTPGDEWFWTAGRPVAVEVIAVRPDGRRVPGVAVQGTIVRREWHRVQRRRDGLDERVGEWVADTVARCDVSTAAAPVPCRFTPPSGGSYVVTFRARDDAGRETATSFYRWATGRGWVPWGDETQIRMDVIPDRTRYDVGDTATVLLASPFTDAEAWVTVEREGVLDQRRLRLTAGATAIQVPVTEAFVPNAFVSVVVVRGRSAPPGGIADPGRPAFRVGYAELKVTPGVKRLRVDVQPLAPEFRPGDSARVRVRVRDAGGAGRRAEVTLWAVDEGVLALTGYRTPDPVELLYRPRGVGMRLASGLIAVAAQVLEEEGVSVKGDRAPGGGGGRELGDVLRSRFSSTAFFLGAVVTGENGEAVAAARLPDNLTTFRLMAVAVTPGDRYGSGQSPMLVSRPLVARPALPRFLRRDDRFIAGVVVNRRTSATGPVAVQVAARGVTMVEAPRRTVTVAGLRPAEVRFTFRDTTADTASFRFDVSAARDSDAVLVRLPVRPSHVPRTFAASGVVGLTAGVTLDLPGDIDPERSRLVLDLGTSPLALVRGMERILTAYPFDCTEQLADVAAPLLALMRAGVAPDGRRYAPDDARRRVETVVATLARRQREDGGIGLWSAESWTTPWLSAQAGEVLLEARAAGIAVADTVLAGLAAYLTQSVRQRAPVQAPVVAWYDPVQARLAEDVAAVDFLSQFGRADVAAENDLLRRAPQMAWEDRVRFAGVLARRGAADARRLLAPLWAEVRVEGRRATLPASSARRFYFASSSRPAALLLAATLAVDSTHPLVAPLVETLVDQGRAARGWWNTQDYGAAVEALAAFHRRQARAAARGFTVAAGNRVLLRATAAGREHAQSLAGLLPPPGADGTRRLTLTIAGSAANDAPPLYYHVSVLEVPRLRPVTPDEDGIAVERWYEDYETGRPTVSATEGALVRVRLRITVTAERRFLALVDQLPAGLEAVDLSLRTTGALPGPAAGAPDAEREEDGFDPSSWMYGSWDAGWWSPFEHRELRDDRVAYVATYLWPGTYTATYVARATTPGVFVRPPAWAEEMYNPSVRGRSDGGVFTVRRRAP